MFLRTHAAHPRRASAPSKRSHVLCALVLLLGACDLKPARSSDDRQQVLRDLVANVIVPTYAELAAHTAALSAASSQLQQTPNADTLAATQGAYRAARGQLKTAEAFQFGPGEDLAITGGAIDTWPADHAQLDALIGSTTAIDAALVSRLPGNQRGFPALEHLLFDSAVGPDVLLARFAEPTLGGRRAQLAVGVAAELAAKCRTLAETWSAPGGYGTQLAEAGVQSGMFSTQGAAIDEVVTGLVYVSELMVMRKLAAPLGVEQAGVVQPQLEEAPRSDSSLDDLRNNLAGIAAIYSGVRADKSGLGLGGSVRAVHPGAADRFEQALAGAEAALRAVTPPLRGALIERRPSVEALYQAIRALKQAIVVDLATALGASIGFGFSDTD